MPGPLTANPNPTSFEAGPLGPVYVTGAVTPLVLWQNNPFPGDQRSLGSLSNGQFVFQKPEGLFQYYVQAGAYTIPALGTPYFNTNKATGDFFGALPMAWAKVAPTDAFSVQGGKLATLIGAENTFTYQNMNIERGLLWNQEPAISRGAQLNYTMDPLTFRIFVERRFLLGPLHLALRFRNLHTRQLKQFRSGGRRQLRTYDEGDDSHTIVSEQLDAPHLGLYVQRRAVDHHTVFPIHPCTSCLFDRCL